MMANYLGADQVDLVSVLDSFSNWFQSFLPRFHPVIDDIAIELQAVDLAANRMRSWRVEAGPDLFGIWIAKVRFGRIGAASHVLSRHLDPRRRRDLSCVPACDGARRRSGVLAFPTAWFRRLPKWSLCFTLWGCSGRRLKPT